MTFEWMTHSLCGIASGYLITQNWQGALIGGIAGLLPDIDMPCSKIGKPFFFISFPLNRLVGHRTFTHSLVFVVIIGIILWQVIGLSFTQAAMAGILSHIIGDMITGRVHILYPYKKAIGLRVSHATYWTLDRVTRLSLSVGIILFSANILLA